MEEVGPLWFSLLGSGSYFARFGVSHFYSKVSISDSNAWHLPCSLLLMAVGCAFCASASNVWVGLVGVWTMAGARGVFLPVVQAIQHDSMPDSVRATGLSVMNFSVEIMVALSYFLLAGWIDRLSPQLARGISGVGFVVTLSLLIIFTVKSNSK